MAEKGGRRGRIVHPAPVKAEHRPVVAVQGRQQLEGMAASRAEQAVRHVRRRVFTSPVVKGVGQVPGRCAALLAEERLQFFAG